MRNLFIGSLSLLLSIPTFAATIPGNSARTLDSTNTTVARDPPFCLVNDGFCSRPLLADCDALVQTMTRNPQTSRLLRTFVDRPAEAWDEWQVPFTFREGTCRITIALMSQQALEWSSFAEIAEKASPLVGGCLSVSTPRNYGGYNVAGVAEALMILVHGKLSGRPVLTQGGSANYTGADLTSRAVDQEGWCQRVDEGRVYGPRDLDSTLSAVNGSQDASGTGSVESVEVTK